MLELEMVELVLSKAMTAQHKEAKIKQGNLLELEKRTEQEKHVLC